LGDKPLAEVVPRDNCVMPPSAAILLFAIPVLAQDSAPPPVPAKPPAEARPAAPTPPDRKAFSDARAQKEPAARVAALERFIEEFPGSSMAAIARREIVSAALAVDPNQAVARAKALMWNLDAADAAALNRHLAAELVREKKLLPEAEEAARTAVSTLTFDAFQTGARKRPGPDRAADAVDRQLRTRFRVEKAQLNETLGQVVLARGRTEEARGLFQEALRDNPSLSPAAQSLAALAEREGRTGEALEYLAHAMLAKPSPESRKRFGETWNKVKGSNDGQQEWLDARYRALFPSPLHPVKYTPSPKRTARVVLGELYTGAGCPPCLAADLAFDSMLERYGRGDFVFIAYHQHIPRPDPMANADTIARWKWIEGRGVPTYMIDGVPAGLGGGPRDAAPLIERDLAGHIDAQLETAPLAELKLSATLDAQALVAAAEVEGILQDARDLVLTLVLVEKELAYSGENSYRFHPMVARSIANFKLEGAKAKSVEHRFDIAAVQAELVKHIDAFEKHDERHNKDGNFRFPERKTAVDAGHLAVVAFVQDTKTRKVLQASYGDPIRQ